jgi:superfamily II DNA or RNA helicase
MKRKINDRNFDLREWQGEALRAALNAKCAGKKDFLCVATPGSGKTKFGLALAHYWLSKGWADRVVILTPSENLKKQWAAEAHGFAGLDIDPDFKNSQGIETNDFHGISITYALLSIDKNFAQQQNTFNHKTFVIFDEPHHMGDALSWGDAALKSFENAVFRLLISGTPFRSDDAKIPFVKYDECNTSSADYTYSYERSIQDNVCRPVYFTIHDGRMKWKVDQLEFEHTFKDTLTADQMSKRLKTALDPKGKWIRDVLLAADRKLLELRVKHPAAGGLIFASTQAHAKEIARVVEEVTGERPPVVISEDADGTEKINIFKHSNWRWLVSVKMVSEGIDIPRLRVGVYFTIVKAELFFRQAVGRFVRVQKELKEQEAYIFIPQDKDIVKLAETIQEERDHALDGLDKANKESRSDTDLWGNEYTPALKGRFTPLESESTNSKTIAVAIEISSGMRHSVDYRKIEEQNPAYLQKEIIRKRLNDYAKRFAMKALGGNKNIHPDFKLLHKKWMEQGGKSMDLETIEELQRRETFYIQQLRGVN